MGKTQHEADNPSFFKSLQQSGTLFSVFDMLMPVQSWGQRIRLIVDSCHPRVLQETRRRHEDLASLAARCISSVARCSSLYRNERNTTQAKLASNVSAGRRMERATRKGGLDKTPPAESSFGTVAAGQSVVRSTIRILLVASWDVLGPPSYTVAAQHVRSQASASVPRPRPLSPQQDQGWPSQARLMETTGGPLFVSSRTHWRSAGLHEAACGPAQSVQTIWL